MLRCLLSLLVCAVFANAAPFAASAQTSSATATENPPAVLVADKVEVSQDRVLTASGNVEIYQGNTRLTARSITYDQTSQTLRLEGPLTLSNGSDVVIVADAAELDPDLRNGIFRSARLVLDQQVQLAAVQINRVDGRYSQLYKTAVTSCRVCSDGRAPLWQIRATRIVHDQQEQQLYFDQAQLWIRDIPVFYLPRLRLPDPNLKRASGFLIPSLPTTSQLGTGLKMPYFIRIGDHKDLTLTPYLSAKTRTLEWRYRQAFRAGRINVRGAFTRDSLRSDEDRAYVFANGAFDLRRGFNLSFDVEATSDDAYLKQYGYSSKDRLDSQVAVSRTRRDEYIQTRLVTIKSLRAGEDNATLPTTVLDASYERRIFPARLGGELRFDLSGHGHHRTSRDRTPGLGRDVVRLHGNIDYLKSWTVLGGLRADGQVGVGFDVFNTAQDNRYSGTEQDAVPQAALAIRYPVSKTGSDGAIHFLEPFAQIGWTGGTQADVANDESTRVEFDEGNLLSLSRFPAKDRREHGVTLAFGLNWARYDPEGWESYLSVGQILREERVDDFTNSSGLAGLSSDFLVAGQVKTQDGFAFGGRVLFDENLDFSKAELRSDWSGDKLTLGGSFLWLEEDAAEDRTKAVSELTLDGAYRFNDNWTLSSDWRYDAEDDRLARIGLGLGYQNECASVDFTLKRSFASSTSVEPSTSFGFTVALRGFTAQAGNKTYSRSCS